MPRRGLNLVWKSKSYFPSFFMAMFSLLFSAIASGQTTVSVTAVNFGNVVVGTTSANRAVTLTNKGASSISVSTLSVTAGTPYSILPVSTCLNPTLAAGASCTVILTLSPTAIGAQPAGTLTIVSTAPNSPNVVTLTGTGVATPTALSVASVAFGNVVVNTASVARTVFVTNYQPTALSIGSIVLPAGYAVTGGTCPNPGTVAAGSNCSIAITLTPTAVGALPAGSLTVNTNASNSPLTAALSGAGVPATALSVASVAFGNVVVNTASVARTVFVTNYQPTALSIGSIVLPAGYAVTGGTCPNPGTVAAGSNCSIAITLTPTAVGALPAGSLTVNTNASNSPLTAALSGAGVPATALSVASVAFGNVVVNTASVARTVFVTNYQPTALSIGSIVLPAGYAVTGGTCPNPGTVAAGSNCSIAITLTPTAVGALPAGSLTVNTNASNSPLTAALSGAGVPATALSVASVAFGNVVVNTASVARTVFVTNYQPTALSIGSIVLPAGYAVTGGTCPNPGTVAAGSNCSIAITLTPTAVGALPAGSLTVNTNASNSPLTAALSGAGVPATALSVASVAFGNVVVNTASVARTVFVTNYQPTALSIGSIVLPAGYAVTGGTCPNPGTVAAGSNCSIAITLTPTAVGALPAGSLTVNTNASNSPLTAALSGAGVPATALSVASVAFGNVVVNTASVARTVFVTNYQPTALSIGSIVLPAGYAVTGGTCPNPGTVAAGSNCSIAITLTPTAVGALPAGSLTVNTNASNSPLTATLSGTGVLPVVFAPASLAFAAQYEGTTSPARTVFLYNYELSPLNISSITIGGANSSDFGVTTSCPTVPSPVPASSHCSLFVTFSPTGSGTRTATLSVADDASTSPQTVALTGSGNAPVTVTPASITNFSAPVGTTSAYQTITIKNSNVSNAVHVSSLQLSGDFQLTSNSCGAAPPYTLAAGASCHVTVSFAPTIGGTRGGQLQVYDDAVTSPQVVNLSGTGTSPLTISPASLTFSAQKVGTLSPPKNITLTNHEVQAETFTLTPAGNFTATSNCASGIIAANSTCIVSVVFAPSANATLGALTGSLSIADSAAIGSPLIAALTGSASATNPAAAVAVVAPGAGAAGSTVNVVITGNGWTHFSSSSVISFVDTASSAIASDITVQSFTAVSANQINATLVLAGGTGTVYGARNIVVTTPISGSPTETAQLNSAFIIADPSNAHTITSVSPAFGTQGQTLNVNLSATGTNFIQGTTFANFGDGITVNELTITDATDAQANITISNTTPVGYRTVTMVTGGEFATSSSTGFQIGPNNATLLRVSPNASGQGTNVAVTLTASGTHFLQNATQVAFTGGILTGDVQVTSSTTAVAQISVPAAATPGLQNVTVSTGGEIASLQNAFGVFATTPILTSVSPSSGQQGQTLNVEIQGFNTSFNQSNLVADFTGEIAVNSVTVNSPTDVVVNITISQNANVGSITANLTSGPSGSATIFPFTFTVTASSASIISVVPSTAPQGGQLTITVTGQNTHWVQGTTTAAFYPVPVPAEPSFDEVTIIDATHAQLALVVPTNAPAESYAFYMATGGEVVSSAVTVYAFTPTLTMSPANGVAPLPGSAPNSFSVSFTGQFTHFSQSATLPVVSGEGVTLSNFKVTSLVSATGTMTIAPGAPVGSRKITFTTGGEIVNTSFHVGGAWLFSIWPDDSPQNNTLDVAITGVNTHFAAGTTAVLFGPQITVNSITVFDATHLTVNISTSYLDSGVSTPSPAGWQQVYVNTGAEQVLGGFLVDAPAKSSILGVSPSSAAQGSTVNVTITGSLTNWVQGQTEAILGAGVTVANLTITSPTTATATLSVSPTAPVGGNSVVMITGAEIESGAGFSVTPSAAEIVSVLPPGCAAVAGTLTCNGVSIPGATLPWQVMQLQTSTLNLVGVGTHWLQGETSVSFGSGCIRG